MIRSMAAAGLLLVATAAHAWEPDSPAAVQQRIQELQKQWEGKSASDVARDKLARARQPQPAWVERKAWKLELGPVTYYFAVGRAPALATEAPPPGVAATGAQGGPPGNGRALDWYYDEAKGAMYTLVVDAR